MCDSVWVMNLDAGQRSANATSTQHRHVYTALCSRKGRHRTRGGVVLSNLNRFSKFSHSETQPLISDLQSKPELTKPRPRTWPKVAWAEACLHTKWHLDASCRLATIKMGRKFGGSAPFWGEELGSQLAQSGLDQGPPPCQVTSGPIQPFGYNKHRPKIGDGAPPHFWKGGGAGFPSNTNSLELRPTSISSGILMHPAFWPQ